MNKILDKLGKKITGKLLLPGDKSISIRAVLLSSIFYGNFNFINFNYCDDTKAILDAMKTLEKIENDSKKVYTIDCNNSATTMRLLSGFLGAAYEGMNIKFKLIGDTSLNNRPMDRVVIPLKKMGIDITCNNGKAPITINPLNTKLKSISYKSKISSAQVKSAVEIAAFIGNVKVEYKEPYKSRNHTKIMLDYFNKNYHMHSHGDTPTYKFTIPSDISLASYYVANAIIYSGSNVILKNVLMNETRFGFIKTLIKMGADITYSNEKLLQGEKVCDLKVKYKKDLIFKKVNILDKTVPQMIDEIPLLSILLMKTNGVSTISGISELKYKESNRLIAITKFFDLFSIRYKCTNDKLKIYGNKDIDFSKLNSINIDTRKKKIAYNYLINSKDHRILLILKLLNIKNIKNKKYLNVSV